MLGRDGQPDSAHPWDGPELTWLTKEGALVPPHLPRGRAVKGQGVPPRDRPRPPGWWKGPSVTASAAISTTAGRVSGVGTRTPNTAVSGSVSRGRQGQQSWKPTFFFFFINLFIYLFIYLLFLAVLGLRFCARAFSSCGERGPLFIAVRGPLTIAASPVAEHRLQTRRLSSCGSRAQLLRGMWDPPRPGLEPVSPALAGGFSTTAPPGKP